MAGTKRIAGPRGDPPGACGGGGRGEADQAGPSHALIGMQCSPILTERQAH